MEFPIHDSDACISSNLCKWIHLQTLLKDEITLNDTSKI